ncbi:Aste57867_11602 [Aphanomyces stellatus]|uniref:Aste57867_11602 protein n=1 Tax=Aphanomyces stellatus TaxID=120398 RepID=A0A485KTG7_9STRA|nr:hypothetical protein As57867_011559 [Aphanomyces stellatus]VFT88460.1 Aste57867_11602 [Aphanomyces stellatus]
MAPRHIKLYYTMDVARDVSVVDLDRAFHHLEKNLHPDKRGNTREAHDEFVAMQSAYAILHNPRKRRTYDWMGEDGVDLFHRSRDLGLRELVASATTVLAQFAPAEILLFVATLLALVVVLPVLICVQVDNDVPWSWSATFLPIWIADAVYLCHVLYVCLKRQPKESPQCQPSPCTRTLRKLAKLFNCGLFVSFQILVVKTLSGDIPTSAMQLVFLPYYVLEGLATGAAIVTCFRSQFQIVPFRNLLRLITALLLAHKLDTTVDISWWLVFSPMFVVLGLTLSASLLQWCRLVRHPSHAPMRVSTQTPSYYDTIDATYNEDPSGPSPYIILAVALVRVIFYSPLVVLAYRLQSPHSFSSFAVFALWFVLGLLILLGSVVYLCCLRGRHSASTDSIVDAAQDVV